MNSLKTADKQALLQLVSDKLNIKLQAIKDQMAQIQEAANSETKSVAGDKYETGRSMAHLELEKFAEQLLDINRSLEILSQIHVDRTYNVIQLGSWVRTSQGEFFISCSVGEVLFNGRKIFLISLASPLAMKLLSKRSGDNVLVNGRTYAIEDTF